MPDYRIKLVEWLKALVAAVQFLTRLPVPVYISYSDTVFRRSVVFYPLAGLLIGGVVVIAGHGFQFLFPPAVSGVLLCALWVFLSGGFHLDGLMDTADGLLSHRSRERMLEIMKDSRVGAMGVIVCVIYLLLKSVLLMSVLQEKSFGGHWIWLGLIPVWSRSFMASAIAGWPYARKEQGLGKLFRTAGKRHAAAAACFAGLISAAAMALFGPWALTSAAGYTLCMLVLTYAIGAGAASIIARKLGGLTGDVYGALNECLELGLLLIMTGYIQHMGG